MNMLCLSEKMCFGSMPCLDQNTDVSIPVENPYRRSHPVSEAR